MIPATPEFKSAHIRGRFAPSPSGPLHFGSLVAAFGSFLHARAQGGQWLLRIEDIDTPRTVSGAAQAQMAALQRHGLAWDGDPVWQSTRLDLYTDALNHLRNQDRLLACRCTRTELAGQIHRICVTDRQRGPFAWRMRAPDREIAFVDEVRGPQTQNLRADVGDFVVRRMDGLFAYQLVVVVDDAEQGITDVVRGADLLDSTPRQIFLQQCLNARQPRYVHLPVVLDAQGHKLGKSQHALALDNDAPLAALRTAWTVLGQPEDRLEGATSVAGLIQKAIDAFDPAILPRQDGSLP